MDSVRAPLRLVSCAAAEPMASAVASVLELPLVVSRDDWFACGEAKFTLDENVRGCDVFVFQSVIGPGDERSVYDRFVLLLHAVEAAALAGAEYVTAVLPYYPGARQDKRKGRSREGISAGLFARCLQAAGATGVISMEIHNEAIAGMFDPARCRLENVSPTHRLARWLRHLELAGDVVASPDVGGMERARHYASELRCGLVGLSKERDYGSVNQVLRSTLIGDVRDRSVLLVDDIIDTAGSVVAAVDELKRHGAGYVTVAAVHPIFSDPAWERLEALATRAQKEGWRFTVVGSSSVRHEETPAWYRSFPVETLMAEVIAEVNARGSITGVQQSDEI